MVQMGIPREILKMRPDVRYVFKPFGEFASEYPDDYFDRVFSVSTLEHIAWEKLIEVFRDMHRVLSKNGGLFPI